MSMGKSIFIIDTPNCCGECEMFGTSVCKKWDIKYLRTFPKDCPLKKLPTKAERDDETEYDDGFVTG